MKKLANEDEEFLKQKIPLNRKGLENYFDQPSEFLNLLCPLLLALNWQGKYRNLVEALPHFSESLDLTQFLNILAHLNYYSESFQINLNNIEDPLLPGLFLSNKEDIVLILEQKDNEFIIFDGKTNQKTTLHRTDLNGELYVFKPMKEKPKIYSNWFRSGLNRFKTLIIKIMMISFLLNVFSLIVPLFIMSVYDKVIPSGSISMLMSFASGALLITLGVLVLSHLRSKLVDYIGARLDITVGNPIFEQLIYLPTSYTENASIAAQLGRMKDFDSVRDFMSSAIIYNIFEIPFCIFFIMVIWILAGWSVVVPVFIFLAFYGLAYLFQPYLNKSVEDSACHNTDKQNFQIESLTKVLEIKAIGGEKRWIEKFEELSCENSFSKFKSSVYSASLNTLSESFMMIAGLGVVMVSVVQVTNGQMTTGALIATLMLVWRVLGPIKFFFSLLPRLDHIKASIYHINALMNVQSEKDNNKKIALMDRKGIIQFNRVSFKYRSDVPPSLIGIDFIISPGEVVCVAGANGAGKSTLLKLIPNLYTPQAGMILIDNTNVQQLELIELRHTISYMPQETSLFFGTIEQNLRFANLTALPEDLVRATRLAGVYDEIMALPKGFQTLLSDEIRECMPKKFVQKLAVARTLVKKASIYIFDEPTYMLPYDGDIIFSNMINHIKGKATIVFSTHRHNYLHLADRVLYLDKGQLRYNGPPDQIINKFTS